MPLNAREDGHNGAHGMVFVALLYMILKNNEGPSDQALKQVKSKIKVSRFWAGALDRTPPVHVALARCFHMIPHSTKHTSKPKPAPTERIILQYHHTFELSFHL